MLKSPLDDYMEGRQQAFQNSLAQRQQQQSEQELAMRQQALAQRQAEQEKADTKAFVLSAMENLTAAESDPQKFNAVADAVASHPIARKIGVTRDQITPQNVSALRVQLGIGPPESKIVPGGKNGLYRVTDQGASLIPGSVPDAGSGGSEGPANVQEWQYYSKLSPDEKKAYLEMKRSTQTYMPVVNGVPTMVQPGTGGSAPTVRPLSTQQSEIGAAAAKGAAVKGAEASAEAKAKLASNLPQVIQNTNNAIDAITKLRDDPGLRYITGMYSMTPIVPGTDQARVDAAAAQIEGKLFLEAYNTLKGGGQITEVEGKKATAAIGRLSRKQSMSDYKNALNDLVSVLNAGLERAKSQAGSPGASAPAPSGGQIIHHSSGATIEILQ